MNKILVRRNNISQEDRDNPAYAVGRLTGANLQFNGCPKAAAEMAYLLKKPSYKKEDWIRGFVDGFTANGVYDTYIS